MQIEKWLNIFFEDIQIARRTFWIFCEHCISFFKAKTLAKRHKRKNIDENLLQCITAIYCVYSGQLYMKKIVDYLLSSSSTAVKMPIVNNTDMVSTRIVSWCFLQKLLWGGFLLVLTFTTVKCILLAIETLSCSTDFFSPIDTGTIPVGSLGFACRR